MSEKIKDKNGFTIMELLIVIAMIVVLVALYIPTFSGQTEKAREAVDLAELRSAVSAVSNSYMLGEALSGVSGSNKNYFQKSITPKQKKANWQSNANTQKILVSGVNLSAKSIPKKWLVRCVRQDYTSSSGKSYTEGQVYITTSS